MIKYTKVKVPDGALKLSPSSMNTFRRDPKEWFDGMNNKSTFVGNKSTVLGTCVHYIFESEFIERTEARWWQDCCTYIDSEVMEGSISSQEGEDIKSWLPEYYTACTQWEDPCKVIESEPTVCAKIDVFNGTKNDYYIAGSIDSVVVRYQNLIDDNWKYCSEEQYWEFDGSRREVYGIRDYKTSSRKNTSLKGYILQLLCYVKAYNLTHEEQITFIEVINIYKLKSGVQFNVIREDVNSKDILMLDGYLKEMVKVHQTALKYPQLEDIIFRKGTSFTGMVLI